jgi:hypothetical protein
MERRSSDFERRTSSFKRPVVRVSRLWRYIAPERAVAVAGRTDRLLRVGEG